MRNMRMWTLQTLLLTGLLAAPPVVASAGGIYRWTTADGTVAFTDDPKRIPARYRDHAVGVREASLTGYRHYTPESTRKESAGTEAYLKRLDARIAHLAAINASAPGAADATGAAGLARHGTSTIYGLAGNTSVSIPNGGAGAQTASSDEPLVVTQERVRDPHGIATRHVTVIRQGGRIVSVVEGESTESTANWPRFQELTGDK